MAAVAQAVLEDQLLELAPAWGEAGERLSDPHDRRPILREVRRELGRVPSVRADLADLHLLGQGLHLRADVVVVRHVAWRRDQVPVAHPILIGHAVAARAGPDALLRAPEAAQDVVEP